MGTFPNLTGAVQDELLDSIDVSPACLVGSVHAPQTFMGTTFTKKRRPARRDGSPQVYHDHQGITGVRTKHEQYGQSHRFSC